MDKIKCQHQDALKFPKDTKLGSLALKNNTNTQMFRCVFCDEFTPDTWICLEESCIFTGCDHTLKNHISLHIEETKLNNAPHYMFLNPITLKMFCFQCNCEIHDFELLGVDESSFTDLEGPLDPAKIRDIFASWFGYLKEGSIKYTQPQKNAKNYIDNSKGISGLVNIGNTSHFNAIVQILAHVPSIRYFYKALQRKVDNANFLPVGSTKKFSYLIGELLANIWSGDWRILKPNDAILAFFELNPTLRGYGYKDIHDTFRCFLNAIHDEHRILVPKPFELGLQPVMNTAKKQDDWEIIDKLGTFLENSIVTDTFQGKMHSSFKCEKCKEELILEDYFTFLDLRIPKEKDPHRLKRWNITIGPTLKKDSKEPTFHVYDALADFFETKFIRPSGNLYCERCLSKTPYQKYYRFLNMPNILCLHIKRQDLPKEQNLKVQLSLDNFDVAPFVKVPKILPNLLLIYMK